MTWIDDMKLLDLSGVNAAETTKKRNMRLYIFVVWRRMWGGMQPRQAT
jgi:hypothetical protein